MKALHWALIPLFIFLLLVCFFWRGLSLNPQNLPSVQVGKPLPELELPQLGESHHPFNTAGLRGKLALLNVWASWCIACAEEQVFLMQLAREGWLIYGLNYKDTPEDASRWLAQWGNPYQMIGEDLDGKAAIELGVYGAPETFLIDKMGVIRYRHVGVLDSKIWEQAFLPRIKVLEKG